jgi:hypothetical protein
MGNDLLVLGIDFVCAVLTLAFIAKLLCQAMPHGQLGEVYGVAKVSLPKVSLQGQQVARRLR